MQISSIQVTAFLQDIQLIRQPFPVLKKKKKKNQVHGIRLSFHLLQHCISSSGPLCMLGEKEHRTGPLQCHPSPVHPPASRKELLRQICCLNQSQKIAPHIKGIVLPLPSLLEK